MFRSSADHHHGAYLILVKILVFTYGELGYAAAYVHLFYKLSCVERYVNIHLHTRQRAKQMNICCRITKFTTHEDSYFNQ
jgi:hypothetical protein